MQNTCVCRRATLWMFPESASGKVRADLRLLRIADLYQWCRRSRHGPPGLLAVTDAPYRPRLTAQPSYWLRSHRPRVTTRASSWPHVTTQPRWRLVYLPSSTTCPAKPVAVWSVASCPAKPVALWASTRAPPARPGARHARSDQGTDLPAAALRPPVCWPRLTTQPRQW